MTTIQEEIDGLKKEAESKLIEAEKLQKLLSAYPDLQKHVGRRKKVAHFSASVNSKVDLFDIRYSCDCCSDSILEIWPYLETANGKVYSDPCTFRVGEKHYLGGSRPYSNWKEPVEKAGIPEAIIEAIATHFKESKQNRIREAEADDEVPEDPDPII